MNTTGENISELLGLAAALLYFLIPLAAMRLAEWGSGRLGRSIYVCWCVLTLGVPFLVGAFPR